MQEFHCKTVICSFCQVHGHIWRDCQRALRLCLGYGIKEHLVRECPHKRNKEVSNNLVLVQWHQGPTGLVEQPHQQRQVNLAEQYNSKELPYQDHVNSRSKNLLEQVALDNAIMMELCPINGGKTKDDAILLAQGKP